MLIIIQKVEVNVVTIKETLLRWKWWPMWKWWWCYLFGFLSFATDAVLRCWKLNHAVIFNWKPMMTVESCHQRWQVGLRGRGGWIWSWCWTHHWSCEARITRPDQARPNTGSLPHNIFFIHHIDDNYARWTHVLVVLQIDIGLITSFLWRHQECTSPGNRPVSDH